MRTLPILLLMASLTGCTGCFPFSMPRNDCMDTEGRCNGKNAVNCINVCGVSCSARDDETSCQQGCATEPLPQRSTDREKADFLAARGLSSNVVATATVAFCTERLDGGVGGGTDAGSSDAGMPDAGSNAELSGTWQLTLTTAMDGGAGVTRIRTTHTVTATPTTAGVIFGIPTWCALTALRTGNQVTLAPMQSCVVPPNTAIIGGAETSPGVFASQTIQNPYCYAIGLTSSDSAPFSGTALRFNATGHAESDTPNACTSGPFRPVGLTFEFAR